MINNQKLPFEEGQTIQWPKQTEKTQQTMFDKIPLRKPMIKQHEPL
jgi:hypothetical protein